MSESEKIVFEHLRFGQVCIERSALLSFPQGLPGFEGYTRYGLVEVPEEAPFLRLLSVETTRLGFVIVDPRLVCTDYDPVLQEAELHGLGIFRPEQLAIYCIVNLNPVPEQVTVNLKGPLCINLETMQARQLILLEDRYRIKHSLLAARQEMGL